MGLEGKVAIITGGGAGIGRACVELFAQEGARAVIALDTASGEAALRWRQAGFSASIRFGIATR